MAHESEWLTHAKNLGKINLECHFHFDILFISKLHCIGCQGSKVNTGSGNGLMLQDNKPLHYNDAIMSVMAYQITSLMIVYSRIYSGVDKRKHQGSVSLAFVRGIHLWPVNSLHKGPVMWKCFHLMTSSWPEPKLTQIYCRNDTTRGLWVSCGSPVYRDVMSRCSLRHWDVGAVLEAKVSSN